jgi:hypothetical protein
MLPEYRKVMKLPRLDLPSFYPSKPGGKDKYYSKLFPLLDGCITLSCSEHGIESLLCSVIFDPEVPCNLLGAQLSGFQKALERATCNPQQVALLLAKACPKISPLWLAVAFIRDTSEVLAHAKGGLPPISLPVASWTDTVQSFVQVRYLSLRDRTCLIPRAYEYSISYLTRPKVRLPFSASPPFGHAALSSISLDVTPHLKHDHRPIRCRTFWILETGEEEEAQGGPKDMLQVDVFLQSTPHDTCSKGCSPRLVSDCCAWPES